MAFKRSSTLLTPTLIDALAQWAAGWAGPHHCDNRAAGLEECASCRGDLTAGTARATEPMAMCVACVPRRHVSTSLSTESLFLLPSRKRVSVRGAAPIDLHGDHLGISEFRRDVVLWGNAVYTTHAGSLCMHVCECVRSSACGD